VLVNLLSNAAQAIRGQGQVRVSAAIRPGGAWADLAVRDTGSGIRPEDLGRIFDPFFTTKEPGVGTGLGLSIVRRIVHDHGGHIDVDTALGRGTEFRIALPAASPRAEPTSPLPPTARPPVPSLAVRVPAEDPIDA
jgi:signal transduction histidine kinase